MTPSQPSSSQTSSSAQPSGPTPDPAALWSSARRLHPIYAQLAREFVIDLPACVDLETAVDTPGSESVERAQQWLNDMDEKIQVHQLRQFLQNSSLLDSQALVILVQHFLAKATKTGRAHLKAINDAIGKEIRAQEKLLTTNGARTQAAQSAQSMPVS